MWIEKIKDEILKSCLVKDNECELEKCDDCGRAFMDASFRIVNLVYCPKCKCMHCFKCVDKFHKCESCGGYYDVLHPWKFNDKDMKVCLRCLRDMIK